MIIAFRTKRTYKIKEKKKRGGEGLGEREEER
jgi:hypothetical protein